MNIVAAERRQGAANAWPPLAIPLNAAAVSPLKPCLVKIAALINAFARQNVVYLFVLEVYYPRAGHGVAP